MTFLKGLILTLVTGIIIFTVILWACLKVASDYDDDDDAMERKNDESSKH